MTGLDMMFRGVIRGGSNEWFNVGFKVPIMVGEFIGIESASISLGPCDLTLTKVGFVAVGLPLVGLPLG